MKHNKETKTNNKKNELDSNSYNIGMHVAHLSSNLLKLAGPNSYS